jgi:hypothetical protein
LEGHISEVVAAARQRQPSPVKPSREFRVHSTCLAGHASSKAARESVICGSN